ncbi:MAG: toll/interleukin-1 receptor domain-containing protein, partial [Chloroflexota bacterium]
MTTTNRLFLSYSRRQFYFAEAVVLALQEAGIDIWFDAQRLGPGEQWRDEIQRGLEEAVGVVMIASEAAVASKYVRIEWEPMIDSGRPVYVLVFEACDLPEKLRNNATAIIDMRGRFRPGMGKLQRAIAGDPIPSPNPIPSPRGNSGIRRVPLEVGVVVAMFGMMTLIVTVAVILNLFDPNAQAPTAFILFAVEGYLFARVGWAMLERNHHFVHVWGLFTWILVQSIIFFTPLFIFPSAVGLLTFLLTPGNYRWLPTGQAPKWMRRRYGAGAAPTLRETAANLEQFATPQQQRYRITYAPEDEWVASEIEDAMGEGQHTRLEQTSSNNPGDQHIVVLSNYTSVESVKAILQTDPETLTPIIASNVNVRAAVDDVADFQFIDYRTHTRDQLDAVATIYRFPDAARLIYGTSVTPLGSSVLLYPRPVRRFSALNHTIAVVYTVLFGGSFISALSLIPELGIQGAFAPLELGFYAAIVLSA